MALFSISATWAITDFKKFKNVHQDKYKKKERKQNQEQNSIPENY